MIYTQHFFLEGKLLGTVKRLPELRPGCTILPSSDLYFCGLCGDVWARMPVYDENGEGTYWQSFRHLCRACDKHSKYRWDWPGSIFRPLEEGYIKALPYEVLRRELLLHLNTYERFPP